MIDIELIRENPDKVKKGTADKQLDPSIVDTALELDKKWRGILQVVEKLRHEKNVLSEDPTPDNISKAKKVKKDLKKAENELKDVEEKREEMLKKIPNPAAEGIKVGEDESENEVIRTWGEPTDLSFEPKDHVDLGETLDIIDIKTAAEVSGARFNYLKGDAVLLQFALLHFALEILTNQEKLKEIAQKVASDYSSKPFIPVVPPVMIRPEPFDKMARLHPTEERFYIESDDLYLVGSAEHTLGPMHMDETINEKEFPLRYVGYSTSFRREAGSYGKDTRGILRVHQFDKIEMESFTTPENGDKEQQFFIQIQEHLMQALNIPYQVVEICTGDMGAPDYKQYDINSWIPSQGKYRETHTADYMTDYQSRRLNTKFMRKGETDYVHMNDATVFAIGRTIIAILENYQQKDGSVKIPKVLQKYLGKKKIEK